MIINIYPLDNLFFRDGLNFDAGDFTRASCIFPPYPPTIYGAIRSLLIFQLGKIYNYGQEEVEKAPCGLGANIETCELEISGYALSKKDKILFPAPINLAVYKKKYRFFKPATDSDLNPVIFEKYFESVEASLSSHDTINILKNEIDQTYSFNLNENLYKSFEKVGIAIDKKTGTAEEHKIYTYKSYQLNKDVFITIFLNLSNNLKKEIEKIEKIGATKFGGEMRPALYEIKDNYAFLSNDNINKIKDQIFKNKRFFLWLITPAVLKNGSIPDFIKKDNMEGSIQLNNKIIKVKLFSWQVGKPVYIGGFDIKTRIPKIMYKAVPAGSIYFFKILEDNFDENDAKEIFNHFHLKPLDSKIPNIKKQGFGCTLIGGF